MSPPAESFTELRSPPKPPLAFRVGIVGHRPNRLQAADMGLLAGTISDILQAVQVEVAEVARTQAALFTDDAPVLRAISPLAEGTDRLFAEQALALGWDLSCVMPFPQAEYEKDFVGDAALEEDSLNRFRSILDEAAHADRLHCLQLDGVRGSSGDNNPYGSCGRVVVGLSDLLIVVWDGDMTQDKIGGTAETLAAAKKAGVPVVVVNAKAPHHWPMAAAPGGLTSLADVRQAVCAALSLPGPNVDETRQVAHRKQESPLECLRRYYAATQPRWNAAVLWKTFRNGVGDLKFAVASCKVRPFEDDVLDDWPRDESTPAAALVNRLRPFYAWPDKLADLYADRYRSGFILCYLLAAAAVGLALLPLGLGRVRLERLSCALELVCIVLVLGLFLLARARQWHERWLDCRLAAELIRHLRIVAPICGKPPLPPVPAHHAMHGLPEATWMNWYLRAVTRAMGLTTTTLDRGYLLDHLRQLRTYLKGQVGFHRSGERRGESIESRLHLGIGIALGLTILACVLHLIHAPIPGHLLTFFCGFLPAVGGALAAINNQGEFRRIAKRSHAMHTSIARLIIRIDSLESKMKAPETAATAFLPAVRELSEDAADLLVREVLDWRVLFLDRPPEVGP
jgi:hypothetical protein